MHGLRHFVSSKMPPPSRMLSLWYKISYSLNKRPNIQIEKHLNVTWVMSAKGPGSRLHKTTARRHTAHEWTTTAHNSLLQRYKFPATCTFAQPSYNTQSCSAHGCLTPNLLKSTSGEQLASPYCDKKPPAQCSVVLNQLLLAWINQPLLKILEQI